MACSTRPTNSSHVAGRDDREARGPRLSANRARIVSPDAEEGDETNSNIVAAGIVGRDGASRDTSITSRDAGPGQFSPTDSIERLRADRPIPARSGREAQKGETAMRKRPLGRFGLLAPGPLATAALALIVAGAGRATASEFPPETRTVQILDAARSGDLAVTVRGAGES